MQVLLVRVMSGAPHCPGGPAAVVTSVGSEYAPNYKRGADTNTQSDTLVTGYLSVPSAPLVRVCAAFTSAGLSARSPGSSKQSDVNMNVRAVILSGTIWPKARCPCVVRVWPQ